MKNALVFDDNKILSELIQMKVEALFRKYDLEFEVDRMSRLSQLEACDKTYQLAFMDIVLPEQDGIDITRQWKNSGRFEEVVFVSAYDDKVFASFDTNPLYFVRKTNLDEDLEQAIISYKRKISATQVIVPEGAKYHVWDVNEIMYLVSRNHYIDVYMTNGNKPLIRGKMDDIEKILQDYNFVRVQVSYLVNLKYVDAVKSQMIRLKNGETFRISPKYREKVASRMEAGW